MVTQILIIITLKSIVLVFSVSSIDFKCFRMVIILRRRSVTEPWYIRHKMKSSDFILLFIYSFDTGSYIAQASLCSSCLYLSSAGIVGICHHACFVWCWGLNVSIILASQGLWQLQCVSKKFYLFKKNFRPCHHVDLIGSERSPLPQSLMSRHYSTIHHVWLVALAFMFKIIPLELTGSLETIYFCYLAWGDKVSQSRVLNN